MTQVREITEREYTAEELPKQSRLGWGLTFARMLLANPAALKKLMVMGPDEERYIVSPPLRAPRVQQGHEVLDLKESYVRPAVVQPSCALVAALEHELGAFERQTEFMIPINAQPPHTRDECLEHRRHRVGRAR